MLNLNSKQRAYLRGLAAKEPAIMQIGKDGVTENLIRTLSDALEARELVKLSLLENSGLDTEEAAAALLHDITKEYTVEEHLNVLLPRGIVPTDIELAAPKTLHAISAAALIPDEYPDLACRDVISSVRWHTTGRAGMSIYEKIIYLADYIDMSRKYPECVRLRSMFWDPDPASMDMPEREEHLRRVLVESFDITLRGLLEDGLPVHPETNRARNSLILRKAETGAGKGPEGPERAE